VKIAAKDYIGVYRSLLRRDRAEHQGEQQPALPRPEAIGMTGKRHYVD
jgi:hypothetical protein